MKMRALLIVVALFGAPLAAPGAQAQTEIQGDTLVGERIAALADVLMIGQVLDVMREEGIASGSDMADEMFAGQGGAGWQGMVALIYDPETMRRRFDAAFAEALQGSSEVDAIAAFFAAETGQRLLRLEIEARRALLDPDVEAAAKLAYADMQAQRDPRLAALRAFVATNDLIESNVMGALNANLAFYQGLAGAGAFADAMPEDQMLAEVWATEPEVRAETEDWLYPFLVLAYKPLSAAELQAYQDFSESPAGQAVNGALFAAFDAVFVALSKDLGRAAARQMQGQEL